VLGKSGGVTGKIGGLVIAWEKNYFQKSRCFTSKRWILLERKLLEQDFDAAFLLVYASNLGRRRKSLYKRISKKAQEDIVSFDGLQ